MQINRCPKCGREPSIARIINGNYELAGFGIECYDCSLHTGCIPHYLDAVARWNEMAKGSENEKHDERNPQKIKANML